MQLTNKKLAFYVALIAATVDMGLLFTGHITLPMANLGLLATAGICGSFGGADVIYDLFGIAFRVGDMVVSLTPSMEDDKKLAQLKEAVEIARQTSVPNMENEARLNG